MTPKELFSRLQTELQAMTWGVTANQIFGEQVFVVPELPIQQIHRYSNGACFVVDGGAAVDPDHPQVLTQNFSVTVFVENVNSAYGEAVMLGGNRVANTTAGAGKFDIELELEEFLYSFGCSFGMGGGGTTTAAVVVSLLLLVTLLSSLLSPACVQHDRGETLAIAS